MLRYSDHQIGRGPEFFRQACGFELEGIISKRARPSRTGRARRAAGSRSNAAIARNSSSSATPTRAAAGRASARCCSAITTRTASCAMPAASAPVSTTRSWSSCSRRLELWRAASPPSPCRKGCRKRACIGSSPPRRRGRIRDLDGATPLFRQASFQGLREDKDATEVVYDPQSREPRPAPPNPQRKKARARRPKAAPARRRRREAAKPERARDGSADIRRGAADPSRPRPLPRHWLTKLDVARYYAAIQDWALPHLSRRLLTLVRSPAAGMKTFYQKHIGDRGARSDQAVRDQDGQRSRDLSLHRGFAGPGRRWCRWGCSKSIPGARRVEKLETARPGDDGSRSR